jgi:hypothetical protein
LQIVEPEVDLHTVQSAAEGVLDTDGTVELLGENFRLADRVALMPLLAFANASKKGLDSEDMEGMAAMYGLIRSVIHRPVLREPELIEDPEGSGNFVPHPQAGKPQRDAGGKVVCDDTEWNRFVAHAEDMQAEGEELMEAVGAAMSVIAARPRRRREISSGGSPRTSEKSKDDSCSPGTDAQGMVSVADLGRSI